MLLSTLANSTKGSLCNYDMSSDGVQRLAKDEDTPKLLMLSVEGK